MKFFLSLLFAGILLMSCKDNTTDTSKTDRTQPETTRVNPAEKWAREISRTHQIDSFKQEDALSFNLNLTFDGRDPMNAKITMTTDGAQIKIEKQDSTNLYYGANGAFLSPQKKNYNGARFDVLTWPYFFALPFKLNDPGTKWSDQKNRKFDGDSLQSAKLTFDNNTGDSPDDWYIVYASANTNFLKAAAYVVTLGKTVEEAEKNPHAIVYDHFITVNDIPFAQEWHFKNWSEERGAYGAPIGSAEITDIDYFTPDKNTFKVPEDAVKIDKPNL